MDDHAALHLSPLDDHLCAPRGRGRLRGTPLTGSAGGAACGDLVRISLTVAGGRIEDAGFDAEGCAATRAAASAVVEIVRGAPVVAAAGLTPAAIAQALGGLSPERHHAADFGADALHGALGAGARAGAIRLDPNPRRTLVAMSGGVDSAVAAQLALDAGDEVLAVTLELWADPSADGELSCCSPQAVLGARALAHEMGIPHFTLDARERFRRDVVENFIGEQAAARTPNPCVRCNGLVRFDAMLALAGALGAARLATGHYARISRDADGPLLGAARDAAKDQSYMLARLTPRELEHVWFPLGELDKGSVRGLARRARLRVADRRESQDLCFLAGVGAERFMERHGDRLGERPGELVGVDGTPVGSHGGQHRFTVGQRRGIGLAGPEPLYVVGKDARSNRVVVGPRHALARDRVELSGAVLERSGASVDRVKLRYRSRPVACRVEGEPGAGRHDRMAILLEDAAFGVAPGQTACLMRGESVIGWAVIATQDDASSFETRAELPSAG